MVEKAGNDEPADSQDAKDRRAGLTGEVQLGRVFLVKRDGDNAAVRRGGNRVNPGAFGPVAESPAGPDSAARAPQAGLDYRR